MKNMKLIQILAAASIAGGVLAGCAQSGNEGEFVQACMTGPGQHNTEALCKCGAHEASSSLPAPQFQAMVLVMQGKTGDAERLLGDMNFEQRAAFGMKQFEILGKCLGEAEPPR